MSMTPVPVCWQTTVTAENEKESCLGFSACRRGCASDILPLRRVRILAERFYRMETKFPIR